MTKTRVFFTVNVGLTFLFMVFAGLLWAEGSSKTGGTVIFDLTGKSSEGPSAFFFAGKDIGLIVSQLGFTYKDVVSGGKDREAFLDKLKKKYKRGTDNRWISKEKDELEVYVFYKKPKKIAPEMDTNAAPGKEKIDTKTEPKVTFEEKRRKTLIAGDISTLIKIVVALGTKGGEVPEILLAKETYVLGKRRALLTVSAALSGAASGSIVLTTGPAEHWFLTADLPVGKLSQVKFVQAKDSGTIEPRETPKNFYLGVNLMMGDILKEKQDLLKNFFIKGMLKISKEPLDGYGVGIGYRLPRVRPLGVDISSFSVFAAVIWTKEENEDKTVKLTKRQVLFGIGYNLDKAMGWVK